MGNVQKNIAMQRKLVTPECVGCSGSIRGRIHFGLHHSVMFLMLLNEAIAVH